MLGPRRSVVLRRRISSGLGGLAAEAVEGVGAVIRLMRTQGNIEGWLDGRADFGDNPHCRIWLAEAADAFSSTFSLHYWLRFHRFIRFVTNAAKRHLHAGCPSFP